MKKVTMTKKGFTTKVLVQTDDRRYIMVEEGIEHRLDGADALNALYKDYLAKGYTVKPEKEVKEEKAAAAPKEPKPKKSREERLTEKYGDKEQRRAFVEARKVVRRALLLQGYHYGKDFDLAVKDMMALWEAEGRPEI